MFTRKEKMEEKKYKDRIQRDMEASEHLRKLYPVEGMKPEFSRNVTLQLTENCNLACFVVGTKVKLSDGEDISIEDVIVGDKVKSFVIQEDAINFVNSKVVRVYKRSVPIIVQIETYDTIITTTPEHPFLTIDHNWIKAEDIEKGMVLKCWDQDRKVQQIDIICQPSVVYNLEVENTHTYIADEFLVHNCTYCYQGCKSGKNMTFETGKKIIDLLYKMWDEDKPDSFINKNTKMIILDFIGGEPMLQTELMDKIASYFWMKAIERKHIWAQTFMISIATNGTLHFKPEVQKFIEKYKSHLSYGISIDGPKDMHDACRVYHDGRGSFDDANAAQDDYNKKFRQPSSTKATIARANLPYLSRLIKYYVEKGYQQIHANYVYEEDWNYDDAKLLYEQMNEISDYILSLPFPVDISLFDDRYFTPMDEDDNNNWCGGTGAMVAFDPDGKAYPCIRYMNSSLNGSQPALQIGDYDSIWDDRFSKETDLLNSITRRSQSTDECFYCPIASGCSWCFKAGTKILTPKGQTNIENLNVGDIVKTASGANRKIIRTVDHFAEDTRLLTFANGSKLYTTDNHPILTLKGDWVEAVNLRCGDIVQTTHGTTTVVGNESQDPYRVYNITLESENTFIANGIKVHNCSGWNYQEHGTPNKRSTRICVMHKARSLANVKHFNKLYLRDNLSKTFHRYLPDEDALMIINKEELDLLDSLEEQTRLMAPEGYDQRDYRYCSSC